MPARSEHQAAETESFLGAAAKHTCRAGASREKLALAGRFESEPMAATTKPPALQWRRPIRETRHSTGFTYRRYVSRCGRFRISVRVDGPLPRRFYAERRDTLNGFGLWAVIGTPHRTKEAAQRSCEREARRAASR